MLFKGKHLGGKCKWTVAPRPLLTNIHYWSTGWDGQGVKMLSTAV